MMINGAQPVSSYCKRKTNQLTRYQPQPPPLPFDPEMIGAIKIKDGLFIGDELASQVGSSFTHSPPGSGVRGCEQGDAHRQLRWQANSQPLGVNWRGVPHFLLVGPG